MSFRGFSDSLGEKKTTTVEERVDTLNLGEYTVVMNSSRVQPPVQGIIPYYSELTSWRGKVAQLIMQCDGCGGSASGSAA